MPLRGIGVLTGVSAWQAHYHSWTASAGLGSKLEAVVIGISNMLVAIGIPTGVGVVIMGVFIASFAGTTLDSATRIQRYMITELGKGNPLLENKWIATLIAVVSGGILAFSSGANGKGALLLWPMFGAINQLLAALALLVATVYLNKKLKKRRYSLVTGLPCLFMTIMTIWATVLNQLAFYTQGQWGLSIINGILLVLACWIVGEGALVLATLFRSVKRETLAQDGLGKEPLKLSKERA